MLSGWPLACPQESQVVEGLQCSWLSHKQGADSFHVSHVAVVSPVHLWHWCEDRRGARPMGRKGRLGSNRLRFSLSPCHVWHTLQLQSGCQPPDDLLPELKANDVSQLLLQRWFCAGLAGLQLQCREVLGTVVKTTHAACKERREAKVHVKMT